MGHMNPTGRAIDAVLHVDLNLLRGIPSLLATVQGFLSGSWLVDADVIKLSLSKRKFHFTLKQDALILSEASPEVPPLDLVPSLPSVLRPVALRRPSFPGTLPDAPRRSYAMRRRSAFPRLLEAGSFKAFFTEFDEVSEDGRLIFSQKNFKRSVMTTIDHNTKKSCHSIRISREFLFFFCLPRNWKHSPCMMASSMTWIFHECQSRCKQWSQWSQWSLIWKKWPATHTFPKFLPFLKDFHP